eukprot:Awhi_evm1s5807
MKLVSGIFGIVLAVTSSSEAVQLSFFDKQSCSISPVKTMDISNVCMPTPWPHFNVRASCNGDSGVVEVCAWGCPDLPLEPLKNAYRTGVPIYNTINGNLPDLEVNLLDNLISDDGCMKLNVPNSNADLCFYPNSVADANLNKLQQALKSYAPLYDALKRVNKPFAEFIVNFELDFAMEVACKEEKIQANGNGNDNAATGYQASVFTCILGSAAVFLR